ncbi:MAG: 1-(5-phosphoribosyl)-5-((5-phosphoribosylamino)methylideneamino)imidazole-4-carboxamide isomerase [Actinobacteria bacterium]|nr:1-(5-phosphoribosyl)-5-((5-phosphoribosylamino)methylideneamino)imidazole-4-carboxamide isomerase [Actinomycetota bacterium]
MDLYPAIDLRGGRCVRLYQGDFDRETVYDSDPVARARAFAEAGAPWVHVVDLDASRGQGSNRDAVEAIAAAVPVPVQTGGGVRDASLLDAGVARVVLGTMAVAERQQAGALISAHRGAVAVGLDHRDGQIRTRGWETASGIDVLDAVRWAEFAGAAAFVVTNIALDATMAGPDLPGLARVLEATNVPVIASGGVGSLDHLRALADAGAAGAIVGKAIYEGAFTVEEAVAACSR